MDWTRSREWCRRNGLRLPSEAEWEYACRAGNTGPFSFGDGDGPLGEYAWYDGNSGRQTHPVGQKKPNAWGLYDMHGNLWEWCQDAWAANYDAAPGDGSAREAESAPIRVHRGGSWLGSPPLCRSACRRGLAPGIGFADLGFRPAASFPR